MLPGDVAEGIRALKAKDGADLRVLGSGGLVQSLVAHDLVDEYHLMIHPLVVGRGKRLFPDGNPETPLWFPAERLSPDRPARRPGHPRPRVRGPFAGDMEARSRRGNPPGQARRRSGDRDPGRDQARAPDEGPPGDAGSVVDQPSALPCGLFDALSERLDRQRPTFAGRSARGSVDGRAERAPHRNG